MVRFVYTAPSGVRFFVTVIEMNDGTFDCYAATKANNGREIPLAIEPSEFWRAHYILKWGADSAAQNTLGNMEAVGPYCGSFAARLGAILADTRMWTKPGSRTAYPQRLSFFLQ